jgi:hypothetical protein
VTVQHWFEVAGDDDVTQVGEPPTLKVWWTAHLRGPDLEVSPHFYLIRCGYWRGSVRELVAWFTEQAECLRTPCEAFKLTPESIEMQEWPSTVDMFTTACRQLGDDNPSLLPLPPGRGILYVSGHVTESEWIELRYGANARRSMANAV